MKDPEMRVLPYDIPLWVPQEFISPGGNFRTITSPCGTEAGKHMSMGQVTILYSRDALGTPSGCNGLGGICAKELDRSMVSMVSSRERND